VLQDLQKNIDVLAFQGPRFLRVLFTFATVRYQAVFLYRLSHHAGRLNPVLGQLTKQVNHLWTGADIAWQAHIGGDLVLFHPTGVVIGPSVSIESGCEIQQGVTLGDAGRKSHGEADSPSIGRNAYIGAGARVVGSIRIGDDVTIGANAVVIKDVPNNSIAVGVPASVRSKEWRA
jgi:serine O-acetyltransferase